MIKPDRFDLIRIPRTCWSAAGDALRTAGRGGREQMLLFAGTFSGSEGQVSRIIVPPQTASAVGCEPDHAELDRIADELVRRGEVLLAQLHSHPSTAFLSTTDQTFPASRKVGWFSAVAPDFGRAMRDEITDVRFYEYVGDDSWHELDQSEIRERFVLEV